MKKNFLTTLAVTVLSAVSLTAWAVDPYAGLVNTTTAVHFNDYDWYIIEDNSTAVDAGTVTLLAAGTDFGNCKFSNDDTKSYNASIVKGIVDDLTENGAFKDVADAIKPCSLTTYEYRSETVAETTENAKLYLLSTEEAKKLSVDVLKIGKEEDMIYWWLRSPGEEDFFQQELFAAMVYGDYGFVYDGGFSVSNELLVRPALQLDLSKVTFDGATNTFALPTPASGGAYADYVNTTTVMHFDDKDWYLIEDNSTSETEGTVTLLTKECVGASAYNSSGSYVEYSNSTVKTAVDAYYTDNISAAAKEAVSDDRMFLLTIDQAYEITNDDVLKCNQYPGTDAPAWWLESSGYNDSYATYVLANEYPYCDEFGAEVSQILGVRPALKLNLSKVSFDTETKTFSVAPTTSVATPTFRPADAAKSNIWYDLNGRHYQGKPTMPGVYINNGEKIIVQ